ncbi:ParM/StbA family protein [Thermodesulfovibrio sp. TK110]
MEKESKIKKAKVLGIDIGFGHTKVYSDGVKYKIPTQIAYVSEDANMEVEKVNIAGREYVLGRDTKYSSFRIEIATVEELIRYAPAFLKHILDKFGGFDIIVSGLPPNCKFYALKFQESLKSVAMSSEVIVLPQGLGILYDVVSTEKISGDTMVIDAGYNTVDCLVAERVDNTWKKKIAITLEGYGVIKAVEFMRAILPERFAIVKNWSAARLLEVFEKGYMHFETEKIDLKNYKTEAILNYSEILFSKIKQELKDFYKDVEFIILAGGGAYYLESKVLGSKVYIPNEPEFSQARGYYVAGQR